MENIHGVKITANQDEAFHYAANNIPYLVHLNDKNRQQSFPNGAYCVENIEEIDDEYLEKIYRRFRSIPWDIAMTNRLLIREITPSDVPRLYELYADESITRYMEPLFPEMSQEIEYTKSYIENVYKFYGYGMWVIVENKEGKVIGRAGLEYREGYDGLELGFMLGVKYQHKGYAYEACTAILEYAAENLGEDSFCAFVDENNAPSIKLCTRLGFKEAGKINSRLMFVR